MARGWGREEDFDAEREQLEPPAPSSVAARTAYITREGYERLRDEYQQLWGVRRPEVVRALSTAAAEGDRSENAEYIYRKKELREIDRRVRYLQQRLPELKVIDQLPPDLDRVFFGAWIEVADAAGARHRYRIVGADEVDATRGYISIDSPLARALLKAAVGDLAHLQLPAGPAEFELIALRYGD